MLELEGRVTRIVHVSPEGDYMVASVRAASGAIVSVVGSPQTPALVDGLEYRFGGAWKDHPKHGRQFRFDGYTQLPPADMLGVTLYLAQVVNGVGPAKARKLWHAYGPRSLDVLRDEPARVVADGILDEATATAASVVLERSRRTEKTRMDMMALLHGRGFQLSRVIAESIARWGVRAPEFVRRNPYRLLLAGITSAGWKRCDKLWLDLGHPPDALKRQAMCAEQAVRESRDGHTWHEAEAIGRAVARLIGDQADPLRALRLAIRARRLAIRRPRPGQQGGPWLALVREARNESELAADVRRLVAWTDRRHRRGAKLY